LVVVAVAVLAGNATGTVVTLPLIVVSTRAAVGVAVAEVAVVLVACLSSKRGEANARAARAAANKERFNAMVQKQTYETRVTQANECRRLKARENVLIRAICVKYGVELNEMKMDGTRRSKGHPCRDTGATSRSIAA
jgi:hypothetical protein